MKWGRKKKSPSPSSSPSSSSSIITRVFLPLSWLSKLTHKSENSDTTSKKNERRGVDSPPPNSTKTRFYSMDGDEAYWRLSFGEEKAIPARRSTGGIMNPVWYDLDHELRFPVSRYDSGNVRERSDVLGYRNFNEMVLDVRRKKEMEREKQRTEKSEKEKDIFPVEPGRNSVSSTRAESPDFVAHEDYVVTSHTTSLSEWPRRISTKKRNSKEVKVKPGQKIKVKAYSPRTECKIRALEAMKRARAAKKEARAAEDENVLNSFAVVKNSFDPRRDFRESMVEMIRAKRIRRSDDLEELLACYLTLNSDEYHDLIIKVFRQVWFELKGVQCFDS